MQELCEQIAPSSALPAHSSRSGNNTFGISSTKELATVIYQALQGDSVFIFQPTSPWGRKFPVRDLAYRKAKILHRDISVENIMISEADDQGNRTSLLVDWDMAKSQDDQSPSAQRRTGT